MAFFRVLALVFLVVSADGCIYFSEPRRPPIDAGGFDGCISSLDPWGRPCCLDPGGGQCR